MSKTYLFYFTHLFLQNTHISLFIIHNYWNKIFISLSHSHRPIPTIHTNITPESTQPTCREPKKQTQQNGSKPTYQDWRLTLSNKIDASDGDGENEKQDRRLQRQEVAMAMVRDIQPHSTWNPLIKPIQPENNEKQRKKERSAAVTIDGRGRKIDERKKKRVLRLRERERGSWESSTEREKKLLKNYMHVLQYPCIFARVL